MTPRIPKPARGWRGASRAAFQATVVGVCLVGCAREADVPLYEKVAVARRDLAVSVSAAGVAEPVRTVDVKSKASGEIIEMRVETGDIVRAGDLLARIDLRVPRNALAQAQADLEVARARLQNAETQKKRADELFARGSIAETEHETSNLAWATARADVVRAETALESARDQMEDTSVKAPIAGTILQKSAELGTVISSPTKDVGGGSVLLTMANLDTMQVRALVDETDIGKIQPGPEVRVRVDAYPSRTFRGRVVKIEPQAVVQQNVTLFPVIISIDNPEHLLRPGMNAEVEIDVGSRNDVLVVPNQALRTDRDVASAAEVLGQDPADVQAQLAAARAAAVPQATAAAGADSLHANAAAATGAGERAGVLTLPDGRTVALPPGVDAAAVQAAMQKRRSGAELTQAESALLRRVFAGAGAGAGRRGSGGRRSGGGGRASAFGGKFIVFALQSGRPVPVEIETGLTDLDYIEVTSGLAEGDTVLMLPSASLVNSQKELRERMQQRSGGGAVPGMQRTTPGAASSGGGSGGGERRTQGR